MEFCHFIKRERNLRRSDERHLEQSELTEETLCRRAVHKPKPVDEAVSDTIRMERLNRAIMELPEIQTLMLIAITKRKYLANGYSVVKELSPFSPHKGKQAKGFIPSPVSTLRSYK